MIQAVPNMCVSRKIFLKHKVNWNTVCGAIHDLSWRNIWVADNANEVLNEHLSQLVSRYVPTKCATRICPGLTTNAGVFVASSRRFIFGGPVIALGSIGKSLFAVKWELMKPSRKPNVSFVAETRMILWMSRALISGGPLLSLRYSDRVCHCLHLLVRVVYWYATRLLRLICWWIILQHAVQGVCWSAAHLPSVSYFYHLSFCSSEVRRLLLDLDPFGGTDQFGVFFLLLKRTLMLWPRLSVVFRWLVRLGSFPARWRQTSQCYLNSKRSSVLLSCQLPTDFSNISFVKGVWAPNVGSFFTICGTQWCATNNPVWLSERSGYLWCTCVPVPYSAMCIAEWAGLISVQPWIGQPSGQSL